MDGPSILHILAVFTGGAIGGVARFVASSFLDRVSGGDFPWGTLGVNVSGSALIGLFAAIFLEDGAAGPAAVTWTFFVIGVLGSYTTVSAFSLQTLVLARAGRFGAASANVLASLALCLAAAASGFALGAGTF